MMRTYLPLILLAALIFSTGCGPVYADRVQPMAQDGVLDLRDWDFKKNGPVELNGEWHFYWNQFLSDINAEVQPGIITPGPWNEFSYAGQPVGSSGYATYRLRILLPEDAPELAIKIGNIDSAARVIVPGKSYSIGTPGRSADTTQPLTRQDVLTLPPTDSESMPGHVLDLRIEISNYFHRRGGLLETPTLDESERLHAGVNRERMWQGMLAAIFIMFGLYHLVLYVIRPNAAVFWFGLFCLVIAGRVVLVGEQIIHYWLPELDFRVDLWFEYFDLVLIVPTFSMLLYALFPEDLPRWLRNALVIGGLLFLGLLVLPPLVYSRYVILPLSFMLLTILIALGVVILAVIRRRPTAVTFLLAFVILATGTVSDIVIGILASLSTPFASLGVVGFIFAQAVVLARRFDRAFEQVETLSGELETRNQDLQRLDKLKDEFLANTSHELRTPLNGIIGLTESLRDGVAGNLGDAANRNLNMIIASGKRLASLVNDILDFQKLRNRDIVLSRRPVDVRSLADVVLAISAPLTRGKDLQMRNDIPDDCPAVLGDENRIQQILQNLIGNAIKFTAAGRITISARTIDDMLEVSVTDTGIGIPQEAQQRIFKSFEQADASTEREYGGTGIGLSVTRQLVELHGGYIQVHSEPGAGARFYFTLPCTSEKAQAIENPPAEISTLEESTVTQVNTAAFIPGDMVLVVDDEAINRQVLVNTLSARQIAVQEATGGPEALEIIKAQSPSLVLLDIMMPRMNGFDVCREIRKSYSPSELPVVFLSARNQVQDLVAGLEAGGNDYLTKPFATAELLARVQTQGGLRAAYTEALRLRAELVQKEKMATIGNMAAGIVHDLKNPVSVIKAYLEMAEEQGIEADRLRRYLQSIHLESDRILEMVQDLLDYSRGAVSIQKEVIDLSAFLDQFEAILRPMFEPRGIVFTVQRQADGSVELDTHRFIRALLNIAGNATEVLTTEGRFDVKVHRTDGRIVFQLEDNGPGIPEEIRETLFEPFVTHGKSSGTGLGLAIVQSVVNGHGGNIHVDSTPGRGTRFHIEIPVEEI